MLGWINKKIGTNSSGQGASGSDGGDGGTPSSSGAGGGNRQHDHHPRDAALSSGRSSNSRRGSSFLDAVGGAIGRTSRKIKDTDKSDAAVLAEQLDAQRAEKISCVAFKLVREIQRILKEARETQAAAAAAARAAAAASAASSSRTPALSPSPSAGAGDVVNAVAAAAAAATTAAAAAAVAAAVAESSAKRVRWAGTEELLCLLNGGSPGGAGEVEDKVERYGSMAEVQAKMSDLVEQALVPESNGDLCGQLLEAARENEHYHPAFVKLCVDAGLPSNLVHCLRIMRVVEFESAIDDNSGGNDGPDGEFTDGNREGFSTDAGEEMSNTRSGSGSGNSSGSGGGEIAGSSSPTAEFASPKVGEEGTKTVAGASITSRPQTERATERIGRLLVSLCRDKSAGVGEQIKQHLPELLSLAVSAYPPNGAHVQRTAQAVVEALMGGCLNSGMVWLLHYKKVRACVQKLQHLVLFFVHMSNYELTTQALHTSAPYFSIFCLCFLKSLLLRLRPQMMSSMMVSVKKLHGGM